MSGSVSKMTLRPNTSYAPIPFIKIETPLCQWILFAPINNSRVRVWDLAIFIPNILFMLFLLIKFRGAVSKLQASNSPIFATFYILVMSVSCISVLRCVVSMTVDATTEAGDVTDKILWLVLRFFLLATELSVVIFGLAFGHLDSRTSIQRVLLVTFLISLIYSVIQGIFELLYDHPVFTAKSDQASGTGNGTSSNFNLFAHGGMIFLFVSSFINFAVYAVIIVLPFTRLRERFQLPTKRLFYYYCLMLATLNLCQGLASLLLYLEYGQSLCGIDVTTYVYFTAFHPVVYAVFLRNFFASVSTGVHFSYKQQEDSVEDDQLSLPYSHSGSINKEEDHDPIFSYDSTRLDVHTAHSSHPSSSVNFRPTMSVNSEPYSNEVIS